MDHSGVPEKQANSTVSRTSDGKAMATGGLASFRFQIPSVTYGAPGSIGSPLSLILSLGLPRRHLGQSQRRRLTRGTVMSVCQPNPLLFSTPTHAMSQKP